MRRSLSRHTQRYFFHWSPVLPKFHSPGTNKPQVVDKVVGILLLMRRQPRNIQGAKQMGARQPHSSNKQ